MRKLLDKYKELPIQLKASFWFLICAFMQKGISIISTPIFTRLFSTVEYGKYNVFNSWLSIVSIFVTFNLFYGVYTQGLIKFEDERSVYSSSMQGLCTTLVLCWTGIYILFHKLWNSLFSLSTVQMLIMLILIWTTSIFNFWSAEQRVIYKYKTLILVSLLVSFAKPIVGILFVKHAHDKVTARIFGLVLVELIVYTSLYFIQLFRGKKFFCAKFWKHALVFNLPLIPHYLSQTVLNSADRIMISKMIGNSEAGIYSLAYSISSIMTLFNTALMQTISPWIYTKIKTKNIKDIEPIAYITLVIIATVNLVLIAFAPEVVAIFAPETYYEAIWVIPPVAMSVYFMFSYDLFAKFAFYYEKTKMIMLASLVGAVLNIGLNYIFIGLFGYKAAGYTTLVCYVIYSVGHFIFMNKVCDGYCDGARPYKVKRVLKISVPFLGIGFLLLLTYNHIVIRYGLIIIVFIIALLKKKKLISMIKNLATTRTI